MKLFCASRTFVNMRDRDSPETHDESIVTNVSNMTNIELKNSIRSNHLNRTSTIGRNNNVHITNSGTKQSHRLSNRRNSPASTLVYYPDCSSIKDPNKPAKISSDQNDCNKNNNNNTPM